MSFGKFFLTCLVTRSLIRQYVDVYTDLLIVKCVGMFLLYGVVTGFRFRLKCLLLCDSFFNFCCFWRPITSMSNDLKVRNVVCVMLQNLELYNALPKLCVMIFYFSPYFTQRSAYYCFSLKQIERVKNKKIRTFSYLTDLEQTPQCLLCGRIFKNCDMNPVKRIGVSQH